jgi:superfamily II DNA helicase RecQ
MNDCELLASKLVAVGIPANFYHSQLSEVGKIKAYYNWMEGLSLVFFFCEFWVMCASLSFGMGIGKRGTTEYYSAIFNDIGVFLCQQMCDLLYT